MIEFLSGKTIQSAKIVGGYVQLVFTDGSGLSARYEDVWYFNSGNEQNWLSNGEHLDYKKDIENGEIK